MTSSRLEMQACETKRMRGCYVLEKAGKHYRSICENKAGCEGYVYVGPVCETSEKVGRFYFTRTCYGPREGRMVCIRDF